MATADVSFTNDPFKTYRSFKLMNSLVLTEKIQKMCIIFLAINMFVTIFSEEMYSCACVCYSLAKCCCKIKEDEEVSRRRCR